MDEIVKPEPLVMSWCQLLWANRWAGLDALEKGTCAFVCQTVGKEPAHHLHPVLRSLISWLPELAAGSAFTLSIPSGRCWEKITLLNKCNFLLFLYFFDP